MIFWGVVIIALGIGLIIGSYFNWDWFMKSWKDVDWVEVFGRDGARIFYALIGLFTLIGGIVIIVFATIN